LYNSRVMIYNFNWQYHEVLFWIWRSTILPTGTPNTNPHYTTQVMVCISLARVQTTHPHYSSDGLYFYQQLHEPSNHPSTTQHKWWSAFSPARARTTNYQSTLPNTRDDLYFYQQEHKPPILPIHRTQHKRWSIILPARVWTIHSPHRQYTTQAMIHIFTSKSTNHPSTSSSLHNTSDGLQSDEPQYQPLIHLIQQQLWFIMLPTTTRTTHPPYHLHHAW